MIERKMKARQAWNKRYLSFSWASSRRFRMQRMKQTWLDKEHKPSNFFPLRGNTMKYQVSIRQEMKRQVYTVQQPKLKNYFKSLTGKQQKEKTKKKKKKENGKNLTGKSCHQGGASSVAHSTDWWHKHPVGALLCRAVEPAKEKRTLIISLLGRY